MSLKHSFTQTKNELTYRSITYYRCGVCELFVRKTNLAFDIPSQEIKGKKIERILICKECMRYKYEQVYNFMLTQLPSKDVEFLMNAYKRRNYI